MSLSDSVATATENTSRLGYTQVCINYLHVASHDYQYQEVIQDTHTHPLTHSQTRSIFSRSTPTSLSTWIQVENESPKYYWIKNISHKHVISRQQKGLEGTKVRKANIARWTLSGCLTPWEGSPLFFSGPQPRSMHFHWCVSSNSASRSATRYLYSLTFDRRRVWPALWLLGPITSSEFNHFLAVVPSTCCWAPRTASCHLPFPSYRAGFLPLITASLLQGYTLPDKSTPQVSGIPPFRWKAWSIHGCLMSKPWRGGSLAVLSSANLARLSADPLGMDDDERSSTQAGS